MNRFILTAGAMLLLARRATLPWQRLFGTNARNGSAEVTHTRV